jgi:hypothetical protein
LKCVTEENEARDRCDNHGMFAERMYQLDHQVQRDCVPAPRRDQPVEDRLPCLVAREIVVNDEEFADALRPVETDRCPTSSAVRKRDLRPRTLTMAQNER